MRARVMRSRGDDLAGAADVDKAQAGQLEVNVALTTGEFLAERLVKRGASGYVGFARQEQAALSRERADAERYALDGGALRSALQMSGHERAPVPATLTECRSYYDIIVGEGGDGNFRGARRALVKQGRRHGG
jgi:hypothetical protein